MAEKSKMSPKSLANLKPRKKGDPSISPGRPRKTWAKINADFALNGAEPVTKSQFREILQNFMAATEEELKRLYSDPNAPMWVRIMIEDLRDKKTRQFLMKDYRDWALGASGVFEEAPKEQNELTINHVIIERQDQETSTDNPGADVDE